MYATGWCTTRIEAKFKLSQNRPAADINGVISGLLTDGHEPLLMRCGELKRHETDRVSTVLEN